MQQRRRLEIIHIIHTSTKSWVNLYSTTRKSTTNNLLNNPNYMIDSVIENMCIRSLPSKSSLSSSRKCNNVEGWKSFISSIHPQSHGLTYIAQLERAQLTTC